VPRSRFGAARVGLISDTHGLLREEAKHFLRGSDLIIHAGDIGTPEILLELEKIAPVTAVRGNNDKGLWADRISETELLQIGDIGIYVIHDLSELDIDPQGAEVSVVVSGHSHRPLIEERDGILFVNPGSAGPRRFKLPISVAEITLRGNIRSARITELNSCA